MFWGLNPLGHMSDTDLIETKVRKSDGFCLQEGLRSEGFKSSLGNEFQENIWNVERFELVDKGFFSMIWFKQYHLTSSLKPIVTL